MTNRARIAYLHDCPHLVSQVAQWSFDTWGGYNPNASLEKTLARFAAHLNKTQLPLTYVALDGEKPVGMASLRQTDGIRPELIPWLGSLYVDPAYRGQGLGERLIHQTYIKAKELGYTEMYLLAFDKTIPEWYNRLGWRTIGMDYLYENSVTVMHRPI